MKIEFQFQPSCSETVIRLSKKADIKEIRLMFAELEKITGWKLCMMSYTKRFFIPVVTSEVKLVAIDDGSKYNEVMLYADVYAEVRGCELYKKSISDNDKLGNGEWYNRIREYKNYMSSSLDDVSIVLAPVKEPKFIATDESGNEEWYKVQYLNFYINDINYCEEGIGIGKNCPTEEKPVLDKIMKKIKDSEVVCDMNSLYGEDNAGN